jgi:hypothetical protein
MFVLTVVDTCNYRSKGHVPMQSIRQNNLPPQALSFTHGREVIGYIMKFVT